MEWLADRFFRANGAWLDASSGSEVRILVENAPADQMLDWDEQCARLAQARHPLLSPLLDYGAASPTRRFEAYAALPSVACGSGSEKLLAHVTQFLRTSGIEMHGNRAKVAVRSVVHGSGPPPRALGVTLQPRRALQTLLEVLEAPSAAPVLTTVVGPTASGLRTLEHQVARAARLFGFMPVSPAVMMTHMVEPAAVERHFCMLDDDPSSGHGNKELAGALIRLARASPRRHVIVRFRRVRTDRAIALDPLGVRSLMGMVFAHGDDGPAEDELFEAARLADGRPGAFLAHLMGASSRASASTFVVHERPPEYVAANEPLLAAVVPHPGRTLQTALRAPSRAEALASNGRHAAAERLLNRSARVLAGRARAEEAAACLERAGALALGRGRTAAAVRFFEEARSTSVAGGAAVRAAMGLGHAAIDQGRPVEAEAVLRGALAAADALSDRPLRVAVTAALVRCLNVQGRHADAIAAGGALEWRDDDPAAVALLAEVSRSQGGVGRVPEAIRLARRAEALAASRDASDQLTAALALAEALATAGDITGMTEACAAARRTARTARLPLTALAARLLEYERTPAISAGDRARGIRWLRMMQRLELPRLYQMRIKSALQALQKRSMEEPPRDPTHEAQKEPPAALEDMLRVCHAAPDDRAALCAVCDATLTRLRAATVMLVGIADQRVLASAGRPWVSTSRLIAQALASGQPCVSDAAIEPREAAEPVRHGPDLIGVLACRWSAGTATELVGARVVLRAAALVAAAPARILVDNAPPAAPEGPWGDLLGNSPAAAALRDAVTRAARAPFPVLIEGESGSGKELVARAIHRLGSRRDRRFCAVNCAALSDDLIEAELFGHSRGAFTGAANERAGLFEEADGGTLFLDEVAELSARAQAKLLRVLQEGEVRRVGENFSRRVDVRVVAATNRRLEDEVNAKRFRADLRFRLDVVRIAVPPLRERPGDVPILAAHFWSDASQRVGSRATLTADAVVALSRYDWPGNVRELQNVIAWIAVHAPRRGRVGPSALPAHVAQSAVTVSCSFATAREEFERRFVRAALAGADGRMARAAKALGVSRQGLSKMMRRLRIDPPGAARLRPD